MRKIFTTQRIVVNAWLIGASLAVAVVAWPEFETFGRWLK